MNWRLAAPDLANTLDEHPPGIDSRRAILLVIPSANFQNETAACHLSGKGCAKGEICSRA